MGASSIRSLGWIGRLHEPSSMLIKMADNLPADITCYFLNLKDIYLLFIDCNFFCFDYKKNKTNGEVYIILILWNYFDIIYLNFTGNKSILGWVF